MAFNPTAGQVAVPVALQNLTIKYRPQYYIQDQVAPIVPVPTPQSKILKYSKAAQFRMILDELTRSEGSLTKRTDFKISSQLVQPAQFAHETAITDELADIAAMPGQLPLQPFQDAIELLVSKIDLSKEYLLARNAIYGNTWVDGALGGTAPSGGAGFWAKTDSTNTFVKDVFAAKNAVLAKSGYIPNVLVIDHETYTAMHTNPIVSDKIKYTQRDVTTADVLADLLQLDEVLIGRTIYNPDQENIADEANFAGKPIWNLGTGNAFLFYRAAPGLRVVSSLFQFRLPYRGALRYVKGYRDERINSTIYQMIEQTEIAPICLDTGYAWTHTMS